MEVCETCLSTGRRLAPLGVLQGVYIALMECDPRADPSVCWECAALLRRAVLFRLRAARAQACLRASHPSGGERVLPYAESESSLRTTEPTVVATIYPETVLLTSDNYAKLEGKIDFQAPITPIDFSKEELKDDSDLCAFDDFQQIKDENDMIPTNFEEPDLQDSNIQHYKMQTARKEHLDMQTAKEKLKSIRPNNREIVDQDKCSIDYADVMNGGKGVNEKCAVGRVASKLKVTMLDISVLESWRDKERGKEPFLSAQYKCDRCLLVLKKNTYVKHMETCHGPQTLKWSCDVCEMQFKRKSVLRKHVPLHFKLYNCTQCSLSSVNMRSMYQHFHSHHAKEDNPIKKLSSIQLNNLDLELDLYRPRNDKSEKSKDKSSIDTSENLSQKRGRGRPSYMLKETILDISEVEIWQEKERNRKLYQSAKYRCDLCVLILTANTYANHMETWHGSRDSKWMCRICKKEFVSKSLLDKHFPLHLKLYSCTQCSVSGINRKAIYNHYKIYHVLKRVYNCSCCGAKFTQWREFKQHMKEHRDAELKTGFECDKCGILFLKRATIKKHLKTHEKTEYKCSACSKVYSYKANLNLHYQRQHSVAPVPAEVYCAECKKQFYTVLSYEDHRNNVHSYKVQCTVCDVKLANKWALRHHYNYHHLKLKEFFCEPCNKNFYSKSSLSYHKKYVHDRVRLPKIHMCIFCGRGFSTKRTLVHHIRTHTGERPHECEHCNAAFAQKVALKQHLKNIHLRKEKKATTVRE